MPAPSTPVSALDRAGVTPLYRQLYERFREAIARGKLRPGDRVPSVRSLAAELGLARGTVEAAYDLLTGEGYFLAEGQRGTMIAPQLADHAASTLSPPTTARPGSMFARGAGEAAEPLPFQLGLPALDAFPRKLWARLGVRRLRAMTASGMAYPDPAGHLPLREAIAAYLLVSRGIACTPGQIFITSGHRETLGLIGRALLRTGDAIWVEDPSYKPARQLLAAAGGAIVPVRVDRDGMCVADAVALAPRARLAVVTPSHQSPLGVSLSLPRRLELLRWAAAERAWIVEDDYDGEYRYSGRPLPALKSLDRDGRVLYAGTFSKVLLPAVRLAYLVVPESAVTAFDEACRIFQSGAPQLIQAIVSDFMAGGHFSRHLKKMRGLYARRRASLAAALATVFGGRFAVELQAGGMHLLARLDARDSDTELARAGQRQGLAVQALSTWVLRHECGQGLLMGFTNIGSAAAAVHLARRLEDALSR